jgi:MFS family permease
LNTLAITPARRDIQVISLVGFAHGLSHFYALALPLLFVFIKDDWHVSFAELGFVVTAFYITSGVCQTLAGFATDRFGGPRMLYVGVGLFAIAYLLMGIAPNYPLLIACAVIAGAGNSVFHPADFAILNSAVDPRRLGYAFSAHGLTGNLGWMLAPATMGFLAARFGWHGALTGAGLIACASLAFIFLRRDLLVPVHRPEHALKQAASGPGKPAAPGAGVLLSRPVLMCFVFFILLASGIVGIQTFGAATLATSFHFPRDLALATLTAFITGGAVGIALGGWAATRTERHELLAAFGMAASCLLLVVIALNVLPQTGIAIALTAAGFLSGITQPSRDMLIRKAAPKGSTGKVYGFVYSGLDAGSALAPFLFGTLLDHGRGDLAVLAVAVLWGLAMFTIISVKPRKAA